MPDSKCQHCREGWICEAHPEQGWPHGDCAGPGMPCPTAQEGCYWWQEEIPFKDGDEIFTKVEEYHDA